MSIGDILSFAAVFVAQGILIGLGIGVGLGAALWLFGVLDKGPAL